ncbi:MAG: nitroreductase family protein [Spirochaetaceae bacterium]|nr:MAG: nitroreductase family protein [Spirochaetaceae bacterium]
MEFREIVKKNRSYRRFDQSHGLSRELLLELVDLARTAPSAGNLQVFRYALSSSAEINSRIFETLGWAASLPDWPGPEEGERPTGYVVIVAEKDTWDWARVDLGIVAQTILLGAAARGLGGCMLGNVRKEKLRKILELGEGMQIQLVIALGKPVERVVLEEVDEGESITYYRTEDRVHHVPKRKLADLVLKAYG